MTQEEKQLLLRDLCARLPHGVRYKGDCGWPINPYQHTTSLCNILNAEEPLVYLRPMSSMTEEELQYIESHILTCDTESDFYLSRHIDYRGLIEKGLALEAPDGMYKTE